MALPLSHTASTRVADGYFLTFFYIPVGTISTPIKLKVEASSPTSLRLTWDPPVVSPNSLMGYSLVFVPVQTQHKRRTHVELFINQFNLTNLRPGTRYRIKVAPLMNNGKLRGVYSSWVKVKTLTDNKNASSQNRDLTDQSPNSPQVPSHCARIRQVCENIGYNYTQLPNYFNQRTHDEAGHEFSQFTRTIQSNCSKVLHVFLCSLYFTPCANDSNTVTPPCRSVCRAAQRDCEPWLKRNGFGWPYKFRCSSFPDPSDKTCVGDDGTITQVVEPNVVPKKCDPLNTDMCKDLGYTFVQMPNFFKDETQNEAKLRIKEFYPLVQTKCSSALRFFLCTLYIPPCVINVNEMIHPCREVCEEARRGCEPIMLRAGFHWPDVMKCSRPDFPLNRSGFCLKPNPQNPKATAVSPTQSHCQPLMIPFCRSLNYTSTILPNLLNHTSQTEVNTTLTSKEMSLLMKSKCSQHLKRFVCFLLAPYCTSDGKPLPPCQSFCEKVKRDCGNESCRWLANLNCAKFPTLSRKRLCFGDPLTTMDCVGPHSRPCTVISSTFPIILKCSPPAARFVIDEVNINLYNGTHILMSSTSDVLRECNGNSRRVNGRYECQFSVLYSKYGISAQTVNTVTVKYHCRKT